jgi:hypothetical protein
LSSGSFPPIRNSPTNFPEGDDVNNADYWQVYFDTNRVIKEAFGEANFPVPEQHLVMRNGAGAAVAAAAK